MLSTQTCYLFFMIYECIHFVNDDCCYCGFTVVYTTCFYVMYIVYSFYFTLFFEKCWKTSFLCCCWVFRLLECVLLAVKQLHLVVNQLHLLDCTCLLETDSNASYMIWNSQKLNVQIHHHRHKCVHLHKCIDLHKCLLHSVYQFRFL